MLFHFLSSDFDALAFHVYPSTFIAELKFAFACHMVTALILFNPKFTFRALLEFLTFYEVHKLFIILAHLCANFIFFASHIFMPLNSTVQAVFFMAFQTLKPRWIIFLKEEHIATVSSWTPWNRISMLIRICLKCMLLIFFIHFPWENYL